MRKVKGTSYLRDDRTKAFINSDKSGYNKYILEKQRLKQSKDDSKRINRLEHDMLEIKSMLQKLLEK